MTQATPSGCSASPGGESRRGLASGVVDDRQPLERMEIGTFASGSAARMTGSASAITSVGVR